MDASVLLNSAAITVSIAALATSMLIGFRQVRAAHQQVLTAQKSTSTLVAIELLTKERRSEQFLESEEYVLRTLRKSHSPDLGVDGLPADARMHVTRIGLYYSNLGMLSRFGWIDDALLMSACHYAVRRCWAALEPYVWAERDMRKSPYMIYFEHLAAVAGDTDLATLHQQSGLEKIGAHSKNFAAEFGYVESATRTQEN